MPKLMQNQWRGRGLPIETNLPIDDVTQVTKLLQNCPVHAPTALRSVPKLAQHVGVASVYIKDERSRMGLGSFKALGATYAIARAALETQPSDWTQSLNGRVFATASAGNHGLSVAAGSRVFGAQAVIYLAESVPTAFADRLRGMGAEVVVQGATYEDSMAAAATAADANGWTLLSDSSWPGYTALPTQVMEGYLQLASEAADQMENIPTHILLQAGVGGLAAAVAAYARATWGDAPQIIVVEPDAAPALMESIKAGEVVDTKGPVSEMGRLDCKTPSEIALKGLSRDADLFATITEAEAHSAMPLLKDFGFETTPSGGTGLAALIAGLPIGKDARVWAILSEGPEAV